MKEQMYSCFEAGFGHRGQGEGFGEECSRPARTSLRVCLNVLFFCAWHGCAVASYAVSCVNILSSALLVRRRRQHVQHSLRHVPSRVSKKLHPIQSCFTGCARTGGGFWWTLMRSHRSPDGYQRGRMPTWLRAVRAQRRF